MSILKKNSKIEVLHFIGFSNFSRPNRTIGSVVLERKKNVDTIDHYLHIYFFNNKIFCLHFKKKPHRFYIYSYVLENKKKTIHWLRP